MSKKEMHGVSETAEQNAEQLVRKLQTPGQAFGAFLRKPDAFVLYVAAIGAVFIYPNIAEAIVVFMFMLFYFSRGQKGKSPLPFRMPQTENKPDFNDPHPANGKPQIGSGIAYYGNDKVTGAEVWFTNSDIRTHTLIFGTTGSGKAQPLYSKILTPSGWKTMGEMKVGEEVIAQDGSVSNITGVFPQGNLEIYEIEFVDGRKVEACGDHLWEVHHKHWRGKYEKGVSRSGNAIPRVLNTLQIKSQLESNKGVFNVPLFEPDKNESDCDLPLEPYLIGAILGDGDVSRRNYRFTTQDDEIIQNLKRSLPTDMDIIRYDSDRDYVYHFVWKEGFEKYGRNIDGEYHKLPIRDALDDLNLLGAKSHNKFIPDCYFKGSYKQRLSLLQGLMDTDGEVGKKGSVSYTSVSEQLAKDVQRLVWSLGGIAKLTSRQTYYTNKNDEKVAGRLSYRVAIRHPEPDKIVRLSRKKERLENYQYANSLKLKIVSVNKLRKQKAQCIMIDHPRQLYITDGYVATHNTEALLSLSFNALVQGSGFIYVDGKGDNSLWWKVFSMVRRMGREDDMLVINFMTGGKDIYGYQSEKLSNTMNPFAFGSSDSLTQLISGLMDDAGGDGAMWKGRAIGLITAVMKVLVYLRDQGEVLLDIALIRDSIELDKVVEMAKRKDLPSYVQDGVNNYLLQLPGYQDNPKGGKQDQDTIMQHGYLTMQFTRVLSSLADTYGHITKVDLGEVDFYDVVANRRILLVLLPALEKSPDELANLGKIIVASTKAMMASSLGSKLEGMKSEVVDVKPTNSPSSFITVYDEYGYYAVPGAAVMPAQARSLGFAMIFAGQDYPAFKKGSPEEAASIIANCTIKICMKLEDPTETYDIFFKRGGEAKIMQAQGFQKNVGGVTDTFMDQGGASVDSRSRINVRDLVLQGPGESHIIFGDQICRAKMFYANPPQMNAARLNRFLRVKAPSEDVVARMTEDFKNALERLNLLVGDPSALPDTDEMDEISVMSEAISKGKQHNMSGAELGVLALAAFSKRNEEVSEALLDALDMDDEIEEDAIAAMSGMDAETADVDDMDIEDILSMGDDYESPSEEPDAHEKSIDADLNITKEENKEEVADDDAVSIDDFFMPSESSSLEGKSKEMVESASSAIIEVGGFNIFDSGFGASQEDLMAQVSDIEVEALKSIDPDMDDADAIEEAQKAAEYVVEDIISSTRYPRKSRPKKDTEAMMSILEDIIGVDSSEDEGSSESENSIDDADDEFGFDEFDDDLNSSEKSEITDNEAAVSDEDEAAIDVVDNLLNEVEDFNEGSDADVTNSDIDSDSEEESINSMMDDAFDGDDHEDSGSSDSTSKDDGSFIDDMMDNAFGDETEDEPNSESSIETSFIDDMMSDAFGDDSNDNSSDNNTNPEDVQEGESLSVLDELMGDVMGFDEDDKSDDSSKSDSGDLDWEK